MPSVFLESANELLDAGQTFELGIEAPVVVTEVPVEGLEVCERFPAVDGQPVAARIYRSQQRCAAIARRLREQLGPPPVTRISSRELLLATVRWAKLPYAKVRHDVILVAADPAGSAAREDGAQERTRTS